MAYLHMCSSSAEHWEELGVHRQSSDNVIDGPILFADGKESTQQLKRIVDAAPPANTSRKADAAVEQNHDMEEDIEGDAQSELDFAQGSGPDMAELWSRLHYVSGAATDVCSGRSKMVLLPCDNPDDIGAAAAGKWPEAAREYRRWAKDGVTIGDVMFMPVSYGAPIVRKGGSGRVTLAAIAAMQRSTPHAFSYRALARGLATAAERAEDADAGVHMPRVGEWERVEPLILAMLAEYDIDVYVYDRA